MEKTEDGIVIFNEPSAFFKLDYDTQEYFLLKSDLNSIKNLCNALLLSKNENSGYFVEDLCNNYKFWRKKFKQDFRFDYPRVENRDILEEDIDKLEYWRNAYVKYHNLYSKILISNSRVGIIEEVRDLVKLGLDIDYKDNEGYTSLLYASEKGHPEIVQELIENGANKEIQLYPFGWTPLIIASTEGHLDVVKILLEKGVNINHQDENGETALIRAVVEDRPEIVQELLNNGAKTDLKDNEGNTALSEAISNNYKDIENMILEYTNNFDDYNDFSFGAKVKSKNTKVPDNVVNKDLYIKIREKVKNRVKVWPSAYASGQLVSEYKKAGGKYRGNKPKGDKNSLGRWYEEKWVNICKPKGKSYEKCGREKSSIKNYPYCRPSVRVSKSTPKTVSELKKEKGQTGIDKVCKKKQSQGTPKSNKPRRIKA